MRPYTPPIEEIHFAAKSGFLSKKIWRKYFNQHGKSWRKEKWNTLLDRKIFRVYGRNKDRSILVLNRKSMLVKQVIQQEISPPPNPYQILHDELVIGFVLNLKQQGKLTEYFFEPEIKRNPRFFGLTSENKFPDAIVKRGTEVFAVEVELSRKNPKRYAKILEVYRGTNAIDEVRFLVGSNGIKRSIQKIANETHYPINGKPSLRLNLLQVS